MFFPKILRGYPIIGNTSSILMELDMLPSSPSNKGLDKGSSQKIELFEFDIGFSTIANNNRPTKHFGGIWCIGSGRIYHYLVTA